MRGSRKTSPTGSASTSAASRRSSRGPGRRSGPAGHADEEAERYRTGHESDARDARGVGETPAEGRPAEQGARCETGHRSRRQAEGPERHARYRNGKTRPRSASAASRPGHIRPGRRSVETAEVIAALKPRRSLLVSWLLGAFVVALVTFSFDALSARNAASIRCPATGATSFTGAPASATCPAMEGRVHCPVSGAPATPSAPRSRCPAGGDASRSTGAGVSI